MINEQYNKLVDFASKKGYVVTSTPYLNNTYINHTRKMITIHCQLTNEEIAKLTHEVGHIFEYKISKYFRFIAEILAWIIGYFICKMCLKLKIQDYWKTAKECLGSYIKLL